MSKYFILYSCCIPVRGAINSIIMDLQRASYIHIPNLLYDVLNIDLTHNTIENIKSKFNNEINEGIDKYFNYLAEEEYGFYTNEPNLFPKLNLEFHSPYRVATSVINFSSYSSYDLVDSISQLNQLGCQVIQIRFDDNITLETFKTILPVIKNSGIKIVEIIWSFNNHFISELEKIALYDARLKLILHSTPLKFFKTMKNSYDQITLIEKKNDQYQKEEYAMDLFTCNTKFYIESVSHNVGLNRKVCIDSDGAIKNFINHNKVYGNITNKTIEEVISQENFQLNWIINNDQIEKCKDCQFRYMCLSNSEIEHINGENFKVDVCHFDPYLE